MTLDTDQRQIIDFEALTFSSRNHGLCVDPKPSYKPLCMELLAYIKDMMSISRSMIYISPKLGSIFHPHVTIQAYNL